MDQTGGDTRSGQIILALPSKGRLQEQVVQFFQRASLQIIQKGGARDYYGAFKTFPEIKIAFFSASEIVAQLAAGRAHLGISGEDLVREALGGKEPPAIGFLAPLDFGHAQVVVAVPRVWMDVWRIEDLADVALSFRSKQGRPLRVATKYPHLTKQFFAEKEIKDYHIVESFGATEGAPAAGQAELIVDITSTGATLAANGLKVLEEGLILASQAHLLASRRAAWGEKQQEIVGDFLMHIAAEAYGRSTYEVQAWFLPQEGQEKNLSKEALYGEAKTLFSAELMAKESLTNGESASLNRYHWRVRRAQGSLFARWLVKQGAKDVRLSVSEYIFSSENSLERNFKRLGLG